MFVLTAVAMIVMALVSLNYTLFFICLAVIAFCFGGFLAVYPVLTADFYGVKNLGGNYGVIFMAYGVAALACPLTKSLGLTKSFMAAAILAILSFGLMLVVKKPSKASKGATVDVMPEEA
ncbi:hypothetical protein ACFLQY_03265 [Verrucomicrobiota bacterium]